MSKKEQIRLLELRLETITHDRDAEKSMKATARMQRDSQTRLAAYYKAKFDEAHEFLKKIPGLHSGPLWDELQQLLGKNRSAHQFDTTSTNCICCGIPDE